QEVSPYEEETMATALMESKPTPGKVTAEKKNEALGLTDLTLSNGVRVLIKSTDFKNDQVVLTASRHGGQYLYKATDRSDAEYAAPLVSQMGVGNFSPIQLRKVLAGKNASATPRLGSIS